MPRRNLYLLWFSGLFCLLCYAQSDPLGRVLVQTLRRIQWRSLETVDDEKLFEGAVQGMINTLQNECGDSYAAYFPPEKAEEFEKGVNEELDGIGVELGLDPETGQVTILSPMYGSPAARAGILANDRIIAINGEPIKDLTVNQTIKKMQGEVGKKITLRIQRPKSKNGSTDETQPEEMDIELRLERFQLDTVLGDRRASDGSWDFMLEGQDKIGYIRITSFARHTTKELRHAIDQLQRQGMKGLIIDLRNNPGGYLDSAVEICDMFIDSGIILTTRGRSRDFLNWFKKAPKAEHNQTMEPEKLVIRDRFDAHEEGTLDKNFPIAVLINDQSASSAEIFAACLQDHDRARIIGERSFGKGVIQEIISVGGGRGTLKLTSASFWRPSKKNIHRFKGAKDTDDWGVRPNQGFEVLMDGDTGKVFWVTRYRRDVNYNDACRINPKWLLPTVKKKPKNKNPKKEKPEKETPKDEQPKEEPPETLPLIDPSIPMIDIDPQLRKAVEWIKENEK